MSELSQDELIADMGINTDELHPDDLNNLVENNRELMDEEKSQILNEHNLVTAENRSPSIKNSGVMITQIGKSNKNTKLIAEIEEKE
jgi:hypothetical protein